MKCKHGINSGVGCRFFVVSVCRLGVFLLAHLALCAWAQPSSQPISQPSSQPSSQASSQHSPQASAETSLTEVWDRASEFSVYQRETFKGKWVWVEGKAAAGGNIRLHNSGVTTTIELDPLTPGLIGGGNIHYTKYRSSYGVKSAPYSVLNGSIIAAGSVDKVSKKVRKGMQEGSQVLGNSDIQIDFQSDFEALIQLSNTIANRVNTGTVAYTPDGFSLEGDCSSAIQVFSLEGKKLRVTSRVELACVPDTATILLNISGAKLNLRRLNTLDLSSRATHIIFNFFEATKMVLPEVDIQGTVLAASADIIISYGNIQGSVIAKSWDGISSVQRNTRFLGELGLEDPIEQEDTDGDGIPDDVDPDIDNDGVINEEDDFPENPNETEDTDGDGQGDNADPDIDNDGIDNADDVYPKDPSSSVHKPVQALSAAQNNQHISLSWNAPEETHLLAAYNIYRADYEPNDDNSPGFTLLEQIDASQTTFSDASPGVGQAYSYRVVPLSSAGVEGEAAPQVNAFIAYNNIQVSGLQGKRENAAVALSWDAVNVFRYRIYKGNVTDSASANDIEYTLLAEVDTAAFIDNEALWNRSFQYYITTLVVFTNPIDGLSVSFEGPVNTALRVGPAAALAFQLNDVTLNARGEPEIISQGGGNHVVTGSYQNSFGEVTVIANTVASPGNTAKQQRSLAKDGTFSLSLPLVNGESWTLSLVEVNYPDRTAQTSFTFTEDTTPPTITLDRAESTPPIETEKELFVISGTATDNSGIASIKIQSDRYQNQEFTAIQGENNRFYAEMPVEYGSNTFQVIAVDKAGNTAQASLPVNRPAPLLPVVRIQSPASGSIVSSEKITVQGSVYSSASAADLRIKLGTESLYPDQASAPGTYAFSFDTVVLQEGSNILTVVAETPLGSGEATSLVLRQTETPQAILPPEIILQSPVRGTLMQGDVLNVQGLVSASAGVQAVRVNGQALALLGESPQFLNFNHSLNYAGEVDGEYTITIEAEDTEGRIGRVESFVFRDSEAPIIVPDIAFQAPPTVNTVNARPFVLTGTVQESNLSSFHVNGNPVALMPGASENAYTFSVDLLLENQQETRVRLRADDRSGKSRSEEWVFKLDQAVEIDIVSPNRNETKNVLGNTASIDVTVRLEAYDERYEVRLIADQQAPILATVNDGLINQALEFAATTGEHIFSVEVFERATASVVARAQAGFTLLNDADIALALTRTEPEKNQQGIEPNTPLGFYFNRQIDPAALSIEVRETAHGLVYPLRQRSANDNPFKAPPALMETNRDRELVQGSLSVLPDNKTVIFYPQADFAYGGQVFVELHYQGESLTRYAFNVRALPTFARGTVVSTRNEKLAGIAVRIPELNREALSNIHGAYSFGFGDSAAQAIPGGLYDMVINPDNRYPEYSSAVRSVRIEEGRLTELPMGVISRLNTRLPYQHIQSGQAQAILAAGDLVLDLSSATLEFQHGPSKGQNQGSVHAQFQTLGRLNFSAQAAAATTWLYALQPAQIQVQGEVGINLQMPALLGSHRYLPAVGSLLTLVAYDPEENLLVPVGIAELKGTRAHSIGKVPLQSLNYLGAIIPSPATQAVLQKYKNAEVDVLSFQSELNRAAEAGKQ